MNKSLFLAGLLAFLSVTFHAQSATFTVTNTGNTGAGAGMSGDIVYCMNQALSTPGADVIEFNIGGGGPQTINLTNQLPYIYNGDGLVIDATTQPGYTCEPIITLLGPNNQTCFAGNGGNATIKGFIIANFQNGIVTDGGSGYVIEANFIGTNATGNTTSAATDIIESGIHLRNGTSNTTIGGPLCDRNVIGGCAREGIRLEGAGANIVIQNNFIGIGADGSSNIGNGTEEQNHPGIMVLNNTDGVTVDDNVISNNANAGLRIESGCDNFVITGNIIGLDSTGTLPRPNSACGIYFYQNSTGHTVGGTTAAERNIISANGGAPDGNNPNEFEADNQCGIYAWDVNNSSFIGNYIGTDITGMTNTGLVANDLGNVGSGIKLEQGSNNNNIGGTNPGEGNVVSGNGFNHPDGPQHGIMLVNGNTQFNNIYGNYTGLAADGLTPLGNAFSGIELQGARDNNIGGPTAAHRNYTGGNQMGIMLQTAFDPWPPSTPPLRNTIENNYVGVDINGDGIVGNATWGINLQNGASDNIIDNNVVANNGSGGIRLQMSGFIDGSNTNIIRDNIIGLDANGATRANSGVGILIAESSDGNDIDGNIIVACTSHGIEIDSSANNSVVRNRIGLDGSGVANANDGNGIYIHNYSDDNFIGAAGGGATNIIANNTQNGILVEDVNSDDNEIRENSIYCNTLRGIELNGAGNDNYAAPVIDVSASATNFFGTAPANSIVEIFSIGTCHTCNNPGDDQLQGMVFVGTTTTDGGGDWGPIDLTGAPYNLPGGTTVNDVTLTATGTANGVSPDNTSEFSVCPQACTPIVATISPEATDFCEGDSVKLSALPQNSSYSYQWLDGSQSPIAGATDSVYYVTTGGDYYVVVNYGCDDDTSVAVTITENARPVLAGISGADPVCEGDVENYTTTTIAGGTYTWTVTGASGSSSTDNINVTFGSTSPVQLQVIVEDANQCLDTASTSITVNPLPAAAGPISGTSPVCEGDTFTYSISSVANATSYNWVVTSGDATINSGNGTTSAEVVIGSSSSVLEVTPTNACGDGSSSTFNITVNPKPATPTISGPRPVCEGATESYTATTSGGTLNWSVNNGASFTGTNPIDVTFNNSGVTTIEVFETAAGCASDVDTFQVPVDPTIAAPTVSAPSIVCANETGVNITASGSGGNTFNWIISPGSGATITGASGPDSATITVDFNTQDVTFTAIENTAGGCSAQGNASVAIFDVSLSGGAGPLCLGQSTTDLTVSSNNGINIPTDSVHWYLNGSPIAGSGNVNPYTAAASGTYNAVVFDNTLGCVDSASVGVGLSFNTPPTADAGVDTVTLNLGMSTGLSGTFSGSPSAPPYYTEWREIVDGTSSQIDDQNSSTSPHNVSGVVPVDLSDNIVEYAFNVTDANGCFATDTIVYVIQQVEIIIPNIITPNDDGHNQTFEIVGILPGSEVAIFNRWGKQVYISENYDNTWQADEQSDGIYYVHIKMGITEEEYKGWIYVVR